MQCADCGDDIDDYEERRVGGKKLKLCEDCAEIRDEQAAVAEEAEGAMQGMMEYKGRS